MGSDKIVILKSLPGSSTTSASSSIMTSLLSAIPMTKPVALPITLLQDDDEQ